MYREKFDAVLEILSDSLALERPDAGFYLWPRLPVADAEFAADLYRAQHLTVLPGSFLGRDGGAGNPGEMHIRMALVPPLQDCIEAAQRIRRQLEAGSGKC